ncbi:hypothetical protein HNQ77_004740 [Silvibacterium bohemicum]|uniref:Uncharacterized protein n=1 Tax=Silvibacterium bohemicum TaxID=1577686 RepID=A0A841K497_9BACT|nr:hypothetical protein [Silvibacterium bohemicum]
MLIAIARIGVIAHHAKKLLTNVLLPEIGIQCFRMEPFFSGCLLTLHLFAKVFNLSYPAFVG